MIIVIARAEVDSARIAELRPALDAMMRATWEGSGCLSYSMAVERARIAASFRLSNAGRTKRH